MYKRVNELLGTEYNSDSEINWNWISENSQLSEKFILEFKDNINWINVLDGQILSEDFIKNLINLESKGYFELDWSFLSAGQILSFDFIKNNISKINFYWLIEYRVFSWEELISNSDMLDWTYISRFQPFIDPNYEKIDKRELKKNKFYQLYQETKDRGWFWGYIGKEENGRPCYRDFSINIDSCLYNNLIKKVKISWKNLKFMDKIVKTEEDILRIVKKV